MFTDRKSPRIPGYDYAVPNYYFITICTDKHKYLFWTDRSLNQYGKIARDHMQKIADIYPGVEILMFVIMPNHVHLLIHIVGIFPPAGKIRSNTQNRISSFIGTFKRRVNRVCEENIWQYRSHDHVIRGQKDYVKIWEYIENNPRKWMLDCFYKE